MKIAKLLLPLILMVLFTACPEPAGSTNLSVTGDDDPTTPVTPTPFTGTQVWIDETKRDIHSIPASSLTLAKTTLHIAYNHTSHGSQLITGMNALRDYPDFGDTYNWSGSSSNDSLHLNENYSDGGIGGIADLSRSDNADSNYDIDAPFVRDTKTFLNDPDNSEYNVILWSWCSINNHDAQRYVDSMEVLIAAYPDVSFIFMTGHAEGDGEDLSEDGVHYNNELIRQHCRDYNRHLYDFAAIESYDPDGEYFWDLDMSDNLAYDGGNWAVEWIAANANHELTKLTTGSGVDGYDGIGSVAHSSSPGEANLNGVLKGMAAWRLFADIAECRAAEASE